VCVCVWQVRARRQARPLLLYHIRDKTDLGWSPSLLCRGYRRFVMYTYLCQWHRSQFNHLLELITLDGEEAGMV
jgi:hypothetical protein